MAEALHKIPVNIEEEMKRSYLDYAMSVIIGRALPDARDGLKPVHRRILYSMEEQGLRPNKPFKKSATVVGNVLGRYHPHGDTAVYDALVRMAQDFSMRYPLVEGQGNFGCFTGDTKIKLLDSTERTFAELAELPQDEIFYVYSVTGDGRITVGEGRHSRITRRDAQLVELKFDDGSTVRCTPDHRFMLRDGTWKEAQHLTIEDSLMAGYFDTAPSHYAALPFANQVPDTRKASSYSSVVFRPLSVVASIETSEEVQRTTQERNLYDHGPWATHPNHRVIDIRWLDERADVYDITVNEHHNFMLANGCIVHNSIDGDSAAAYRYTEARLTRIATEMLADIDKDTVDFVPNYDESLREPVVVPARFPNLLVNGASGIAVGMATNIPPHNLSEAIEAAVYLIQNPNARLKTLMGMIPGPDFPTGGFIYGREGIQQAYETGRGTIVMRARATIDRAGRAGERMAILVTEIPFQVNKAKLIERMAELVNDKKLEGISDLRDESGREGMRIMIELKRDAIPDIVLNNLYKLTAMQQSFGVINLAIVNGQPRVLSLIDTLNIFIDHRREVVTRRSRFELRKAEARAHILEGLKKAIDNLDAVISLIRKSKGTQEAREALMLRFKFTEAQARAILEMQLQRLTGLERQKLIDEYKEVIQRIAELQEILSNDMVLRGVIVKELREVQHAYRDARRTEIIEAGAELTLEDLIADEDMAITVTHSGYIKRTPVSVYRAQRRGGTGRRGAALKTEDVVDHLFVASTHSYIMIFTNNGQVYKLKVHEIPDAGAAGKGKAIVNLLNMPKNEKVAGIITVRAFEEGKYVVTATRKGTIKKTKLSDFANIRSRGINAMGINEDDELIAVELTDGNMKIFLATHLGMAICFEEAGVRPMGRPAYGVRGISLNKKDYVISVAAVTGEEEMLSISENGFGKRTKLEAYRVQSRGGRGVINMKTSERNGKVVAVLPVNDESQVLIITNQGKLIRVRTNGIRESGRSTQGVKLIDTSDGDTVSSASLIERQRDDTFEEQKLINDA
ncbi:MAG: DNA gyrase subunit A [Blastocatellia bacterium]|nr:DNA gyrase subunit A [Blastocatellia bacterium]